MLTAPAREWRRSTVIFLESVAVSPAGHQSCSHFILLLPLHRPHGSKLTKLSEISRNIRDVRGHSESHSTCAYPGRTMSRPARIAGLYVRGTLTHELIARGSVDYRTCVLRNGTSVVSAESLRSLAGFPSDHGANESRVATGCEVAARCYVYERDLVQAQKRRRRGRAVTIRREVEDGQTTQRPARF
jgi:hypothetical protein